jgi:importin subunit beta-1
MCSIAVGTVGDLCRALNDKMVDYTDNILHLLVVNLQSNVLHRNVKPVILSAFGDIALAIGGHFDKYLAGVMNILQQAATSTQQQTMDYEMIDYFLQLREGILEAYVGIVQGLKGDNKGPLLMEFVPGVFGFLQVCYNDPEKNETIVRSMLGLLGDLAEALPAGQLKPIYQSTWIDSLLREAKTGHYTSNPTREVAKWAREMIKRQIQ